MKFLMVSGGHYRLGTSLDGIEKCVQEWKDRLINDSYTENNFRSWIRKEYPDHWIYNPSYELQEVPVTNAEAKIFLRESGAEVPESICMNEPTHHPVWGVSLCWVNAYARWLSSRQMDFEFRLPTETEWEIAARGHDFREFPYGNEFNPQAANTLESKIGCTTPVGYYVNHPGPYGHFDLAGNVEEWVSTPYYIYPNGELIRDDLFNRLGTRYAILRGGSFACGGDLSRSARRHGPFPDPKFRYIGFRLVREPKSPH